MKMVRHETEAQDANWILGCGRLQQSQERSVVAVLVKDDGPTVTTIQNMIGMASELSMGNARHKPRQYGMSGVAGKRKVACPSFISQAAPGITISSEAALGIHP